jgi:hypothetical protein
VISPENGGIIFANNILPFNNFTSKKKDRNFNKNRRLSSCLRRKSRKQSVKRIIQFFVEGSHDKIEIFMSIYQELDTQ